MKDEKKMWTPGKPLSLSMGPISSHLDAYQEFPDWSLAEDVCLFHGLKTYRQMDIEEFRKEFLYAMSNVGRLSIPNIWARMQLSGLVQWMFGAGYTTNYETIEQLIRRLPTRFDFDLPLPQFLCLLINTCLDDGNDFCSTMIAV